LSERAIRRVAVALQVAYLALAFGRRSWRRVASMAAGVVGTLRAQLELGESWRVGVAPEERTVLITTGISVQVRVVEEPYLRSVHGPASDEYVRATGRFLPRMRTGG
jgi:protein-S-isoprenylcysteine O-methyltransferase Ste14